MMQLVSNDPTDVAHFLQQLECLEEIIGILENMANSGAYDHRAFESAIKALKGTAEFQRRLADTFQVVRLTPPNS